MSIASHNLEASEITAYKNAFDMVGIPFVLISDKLQMVGVNNCAKDLLQINHTLEITAETSLSIRENSRIAQILDSDGELVTNCSMQYNNKFIKWEKKTISINKAPYFVLLGIDTTESESLLNILQDQAENTIGYVNPNKSDVKQYINQISNYYTSIIEKIPCYIYWKNIKLEYLGCNQLAASFVRLKSPKDIIGKTDFNIFIDHELAKSYQDADKELLSKGGSILNQPGKLTNEDGETFYTLVSKAPISDLYGNIIGLVGITVDVTETEKAKEVAEEANIAKTVFISNISHDIRTPLSGVIGLSNIIENEEKDPTLKMHAHHIAQSADELLNMLNQVINAVSSGKLKVDNVRSEPFDLRHLIESLINLESPPAYLNHIQLETHIDDQIPNLLVGDHDKIYHIVLNLVGNALKFTQKGYIKINITLAKRLSDSVQLLFEVSDTGMGIPPESLDKVFEMFYKVTPSYKGKDKGHGMGLYIVKTYTELLGGQVSVESKLNEGSKFSFTLTLNIAEENAKPQNIVQSQSVFSSDTNAESIQRTDVSTHSNSSQEKVSEKPQNKPKILVIEDNKVMLSLVKTLVEEAKCNPTTVEDCESGLEFAKTKHFDLIFSDIGLPGISGIEFAQKLRQYEKDYNKSPVPIVAITGHGQAIEKECLEAGMNYVIIKPLKPETLTELCNEFALFGGTQYNPSHLDKPSLKLVNIQCVGALGPDLPNTEAELFEIDNLPIFDIENAGRLLGDNTALLMKMLRDNINIVIPEELPRLKKAHDDNDWQVVADIIHKLKGGFLSISLTRIATACQYLERYQQAGHSASFEKLYQQFLEILEITIEQLKPWSE